MGVGPLIFNGRYVFTLSIIFNCAFTALAEYIIVNVNSALGSIRVNTRVFETITHSFGFEERVDGRRDKSNVFVNISFEFLCRKADCSRKCLQKPVHIAVIFDIDYSFQILRTRKSELPVANK